MKSINVLSTFNSMGCIWYALDRVGIKVNKRYSSEIDKYANQANNVAYPDTIQLNDITKWREWDIDWSSIDLFVGGSPCQGFSFAGKQLNFSDERSKLFFVFVEIWDHILKCNPDAKFLLENVNMKKEYLRVISEYLGVFPVRINSNLLSAQNRDRWYWTNIQIKETGLFNELWTDIPQPEDKGILLKDILQPESEVDEKYFYSKKACEYLERTDINKRFIINANNEKSNTLTANYQKGLPYNVFVDTNKSNPITANYANMDPRNYNKSQGQIILKIDKRGNKKADQQKAGCLTAGGHSGGNHSDMDLFTNGIYIRRLTPRECGRLQTFTDSELDVLLNSGISDTQLYKMFGNGWTINVIAHILSFITF